jgi:multiple sugar transport system ATP-binding protein
MGTLQLRGLRKTFGEVKAVDGIDLSVADGEFFVILGPSGAGKTTTLKSIAGLVDIDEGAVEIAGTDMTGVEPYHRNVAMAFESYALYPQKTVQENLASPLRSGRTGAYADDDQQARIDQVTTTLGINHLLGRLPRELSNGQRQRTALGRVLVRPADVYLLDEPLSHLDAKLRAAMRAELKQIAQTSNTTTVYVTHDYQEALALGDRIAVLRKGRFVQVGTPEEMWRQPVDTFVAKSLGQPEINLIDARVEGGRVVFGSGAGSFAAPAGLDLAEGQSVRLGLRPSELEVDRGHRTGGEWLALPGRVVLAERLGRQVELDVHVGDQQLIVVEDSDHAPAEGREVSVQIHLPNVHIFASGEEGEDTLRLGSATGRHSAALPEEARR